jgi:acyl-CoA thioester hydrolase
MWTYDKVRYGDTDRQGHVNNAVYATFLETGRVDFLYDNELALAMPGCEFVIARLAVDYRTELYYPGIVDIGTRILAIGRSSFTVGQGIFNGDTCVATAENVLVQMNEKSRRAEKLGPTALAWLAERLATR